ncbi:hypothetical protein P0Y35_07355 [Kiritimatiellaeota bacterium B1221]|nr:hypothetical protein [Kiritimatiellaeota bacterium B1221]
MPDASPLVLVTIVGAAPCCWVAFGWRGAGPEHRDTGQGRWRLNRGSVWRSVRQDQTDRTGQTAPMDGREFDWDYD